MNQPMALAWCFSLLDCSGREQGWVRRVREFCLLALGCSVMRRWLLVLVRTCPKSLLIIQNQNFKNNQRAGWWHWCLDGVGTAAEGVGEGRALECAGILPRSRDQSGPEPWEVLESSLEQGSILPRALGCAGIYPRGRDQSCPEPRSSSAP